MDSSKSNKVKITELPIYPSCCSSHGSCSSAKSAPANPLEDYVKQARVEVENVVNPLVGDYPQRVSESLQTAQLFLKDMIVYVRDEQNQAARATFVTSSAFLGFLLGRRGFFRRSLFALVGGGSAAAACNPQLAKDYAEVSYELTKQKTTQLYEQYGGDLKNISWSSLMKSESSSPK